jgi:hypothetical protein
MEEKETCETYNKRIMEKSDNKMKERFSVASFLLELERRTEFTVKEEHLKLLKNMNVGWQEVENGAPEIDPKRPYGDGDLVESIGKILGIKPIETEDEEKIYPAEQALAFRKLHLETRLVLEICLETASFKIGDYMREGLYGHRWMRVITIE